MTEEEGTKDFDLEFEFLRTRRMVHMSIFNHRNVNPYIDTAISSLYVPVSTVSKRQTRQGITMCMRIPPFRTCMGQKCISYFGPSTWNQLPHDARLISSHVSFKTHVKEFSRIFFENHPT